jgi:hypothetical protein
MGIRNSLENRGTNERGRKMLEFELEHRFTYHPPRDGQPAMYEAIRDTALEYAKLINVLVPDSREKSTALTKLDEVVFWSNAGIARHA